MPTQPTTAQSLGALLKSARDIMRNGSRGNYSPLWPDGFAPHSANPVGSSRWISNKSELDRGNEYKRCNIYSTASRRNSRNDVRLGKILAQ